jgi:cell division septation protein DedD
MEREWMRTRGLSFLIVAAAVLQLGACSGGDSGNTGEAAETPAARPEATTPAEAAPESEPSTAESAPRTATSGIVQEAAESPYGFYTVQVSSWRTESTARDQAEHYRNQGLEAYVQRADLGELGIWFRVRIGRYPSLTEARRAAAALRDIPEAETWVDNFTAGETPPP